jgi:hypothetical protein
MKMTFGKYRGQPISQVQGDAGYLQWLLAQDWLGKAYPDVAKALMRKQPPLPHVRRPRKRYVPQPVAAELPDDRVDDLFL